MENVKMDLKGNVLTITIDLSKRFGKSNKGAGPNEIVASTKGNVSVGDPNAGIKLGINAYAPPRA